MKKWFVIALLSVMMLCTISAQAENTKIVFWHSMSEEAGTLKPFVREPMQNL